MLTEMMRKIFTSLTVLGLLAGSAVAQDRMMSMYLEPDVNGTVYFQESMTSLNRLEPRPLLDGSGAGQGWMFVQYPGRYVGYVVASDVNGNSLNNGAKAYLRQDVNSPVLAVILDGGAAEVARVQDGWATVYFEGEAPAYFRMDQSAPASIAATAPAARVGAPSQAPSATTAASAPPVLEEVVMQQSTLPTPAPAAVQPPNKSVARYLTGRLERVTIWDRTWGPDYDYRLVDANGDTYAYVNLDESLLFGPVESYWGQQVEIKGAITRRLGQVKLVIDTDSIRVLR